MILDKNMMVLFHQEEVVTIRDIFDEAQKFHRRITTKEQFIEMLGEPMPNSPVIDELLNIVSDNISDMLVFQRDLIFHQSSE